MKHPEFQEAFPHAGDTVATVVESLAWHAASQPDSPAYVDAHGVLGYGALYEAARRGAAWLVQQGVRSGDTVALSLDNRLANARLALQMFYSIAHAGAVVLPLLPEVPAEVRIDLIGRYRAAWLITGGAAGQVAGAQVLDPAGFDPADPRHDALPALRADRPEAPFAYRFTSGTTGSAKVLLPTHGQFFGNSRASANAFGTRRNDRQMAAIPWPSGLSMRYLFRAHAVGAAFVSAPPGETLDELRVNLTRFGVTQLSLSPWQVRRLLLTPAPAQALPPLRFVHVMGAFMSIPDLAAARERLSPNIFLGYGCNETGSISLLGPGAPAPGPGCVGRLLPGMQARVTGAQGEELAPEQIGELSFRAPWMCTGYVDNPQATGERFRDGWFHPGDAGSIDAQGNVYLRGRTQEMINFGGLKIWPEDMEAVLKQHPDVLDAALVGLPDAQAGQVPAAFVTMRRPQGAPMGGAALHAFCAARVDATRVPVHFVIIDRIPRNDAGKIMREALVQAYLGAAGTPGA